MVLDATLINSLTCFTLTRFEYPTVVTSVSVTSSTGLVLVGEREFKRLSDAEEEDNVVVEGQEDEPAKLDTKLS